MLAEKAMNRGRLHGTWDLARSNLMVAESLPLYLRIVKRTFATGCFIWCPGTESNRRHEDFQCDLDGANSKPLSQNQPIKYQSATVLSRSSVPFGTILCLRAPTNPCVNPDGLCQKTSRTRLDRSRATPGGENIPLLRIRAAHAHTFKLHITPSRYRPTEPKASCPSNHPRTIDRSAPFFFMAATPPPVALQKAHGAGPPVRG